MCFGDSVKSMWLLLLLAMADDKSFISGEYFVTQTVSNVWFYEIHPKKTIRTIN